MNGTQSGDVEPDLYLLVNFQKKVLGAEHRCLNLPGSIGDIQRVRSFLFGVLALCLQNFSSKIPEKTAKRKPRLDGDPSIASLEYLSCWKRQWKLPYNIVAFMFLYYWKRIWKLQSPRL